MYFAKKSKSWTSGGVGFIKTTKDEKANTYGRMYLITKDQFEEVIKQETNYKNTLSIDYDKAVKEGNYIFREKSWYGNLIYLGDCEKSPIFTFTNEIDLDDEINPPDTNYVKIIASGIKEKYNLTQEDLEQYFKSKSGITGEDIEEKLNDLFKN